MSTILPKSAGNPKYIFNQSGLASFNGGWIDCAGISSLSINVWWSAVAATAGTFAFESSDDMSEGQAPNPAAGSIVQLTLTTPSAGTTTGFHGNAGSFSAGAAASSFMAILARPPRLVRITYTRSAGGGADQFNAAWHGRAS
jgi:hypothetical protein